MKYDRKLHSWHRVLLLGIYYLPPTAAITAVFHSVMRDSSKKMTVIEARNIEPIFPTVKFFSNSIHMLLATCSKSRGKMPLKKSSNLRKYTKKHNIFDVEQLIDLSQPPLIIIRLFFRLFIFQGRITRRQHCQQTWIDGRSDEGATSAHGQHHSGTTTTQGI